mmetsp:Transcript_13239/g.41870  ORF Transcript_13239/g.41870 Transcript_13239/m.41870 type:complete len:234 (+) Transcript_13239:1068-1769(+)
MYIYVETSPCHEDTGAGHSASPSYAPRFPRLRPHTHAHALALARLHHRHSAQLLRYRVNLLLFRDVRLGLLGEGEQGGGGVVVLVQNLRQTQQLQLPVLRLPHLRVQDALGPPGGHEGAELPRLPQALAQVRELAQGGGPLDRRHLVGQGAHPVHVELLHPLPRQGRHDLRREVAQHGHVEVVRRLGGHALRREVQHHLQLPEEVLGLRGGLPRGRVPHPREGWPAQKAHVLI